MLQEIIGDLPIDSNNDKFLTKFYSGTSRIIDTMMLMSFFELLLEHLLEFLLIARKSRDAIEKVFSHAHVRSVKQRARNAHDQNERLYTYNFSFTVLNKDNFLFSLGPVFRNTLSSRTISFSMKTQRVYCIYTSFLYRFHFVLFGNRFQNLSLSVVFM